MSASMRCGFFHDTMLSIRAKTTWLSGVCVGPLALELECDGTDGMRNDYDGRDVNTLRSRVRRGRRDRSGNSSGPVLSCRQRTSDQVPILLFRPTSSCTRKVRGR